MADTVAPNMTNIVSKKITLVANTAKTLTCQDFLVGTPATVFNYMQILNKSGSGVFTVTFGDGDPVEMTLPVLFMNVKFAKIVVKSVGGGDIYVIASFVNNMQRVNLIS